MVVLDWAYKQCKLMATNTHGLFIQPRSEKKKKLFLFLGSKGSKVPLSFLGKDGVPNNLFSRLVSRHVVPAAPQKQTCHVREVKTATICMGGDAGFLGHKARCDIFTVCYHVPCIKGQFQVDYGIPPWRANLASPQHPTKEGKWHANDKGKGGQLAQPLICL